MSKLNHLNSPEKYSLLANTSEMGGGIMWVLKACPSIQWALNTPIPPLLDKSLLSRAFATSTKRLCAKNSFTKRERLSSALRLNLELSYENNTGFGLL